MSTIRTNTLSNVAGTQSTAIENAINGSAKAWVNFNGQGTVAIRGSYNVSSITDIGTGTYQVNLTTAMPDANFSCTATCFHQGGVTADGLANFASPFSNNTAVFYTTINGAAFDSLVVCAVIFR
jgi:hypothetical protein